jgi:membrane associated rhomboid family serine protease
MPNTRSLRLPKVLATFGRDLKRAIVTFAIILAVLWSIELLNGVTYHALSTQWGLIPRTREGAPGIVLHPLLHANTAHLLANTLGLLVLGGVVMLRDARDFWTTTLLGALVGGIGGWIFARPSIHVGASGVIFAYLGYLLTTGFFDRRISSVLISITAALLWGSLLFGLSPFQARVSWELHLFGFIGGIVAASLRPNGRKRRR